MNRDSANQYQNEALRTIGKQSKTERLLNCALGLCGESGEVADHIKKAYFQGHRLDQEHLAKELGDCSWYLAVLADTLGYPLSTIFSLNIEKLQKRYPDGFSAERSVNRSADDD